jgi:hypothetical protein
MLEVYRSAALLVACRISQEVAVPMKPPELTAEEWLSAPGMVATLAALAGLEVARPVPPLAALVGAPRMAAMLAALVEQAGLVLVRPVPPLAGLVAPTVVGWTVSKA